MATTRWEVTGPPNGRRRPEPRPAAVKARSADRHETGLRLGRSSLERAALAYVSLTGAMLAVGLVVVGVTRETPVGAVDRSITRWLAEHRVAALDDLTAVLSTWADTWSIVIGGLGAAIALLAVRAWRTAAVVALALFLEVTVFLSVTWTIARPRPAVGALDSVPATASFPSGHVAASVVLYAGWAFIVRDLRGPRAVVRATTVIAVLVPVAVAFSRVYRGLHHPLDVMAGATLGMACLIVAAVLVRAAAAEREALRASRGTGEHAP